MLLACVKVLASDIILTCVIVFVRVMVLPRDGWGAKVTRPEHPKGAKDEVKQAQRAAN